MYFDSTITAYSENPKWRTQFRTFKDIYTNSKIAISQQVIITTTSTMFKDGKDGDFMSIVDKLGDFILIADECHNMATDRIVNSLPSPSWRLGLSATPESVSKKELSDKIISYFGGIIAEYSLGDAIRDKKLVEYNYYPVFVEFTEEEKNEYDILSKNIAKLQSMLKETKDFEMRQSLEMTLFKRARIVYGAANKLPKLKEMLQDDAIERDHLLIYCGATSYQIPPIDDETEDVIENEENTQITLSQLNLVNELLRDLDIKAVQYTQSESEADRRLAFELFRTNTFSTLVAIKCLDEGVNIPEIENAIILASSGNIREFIQRRGRILRKSEGKDYANIYDFVVRDYEDFNSSLNIKETRRIMEYAKEARNYHQIYNENIEYIEMVKEKDDEQRDEF